MQNFLNNLKSKFAKLFDRFLYLFELFQVSCLVMCISIYFFFFYYWNKAIKSKKNVLETSLKTRWIRSFELIIFLMQEEVSMDILN